MTFNIVTN